MSESTSRLTAALSGRYRIEEKLGEGGMASVYLAEDLKHERKVAVKILRPDLAAVIGAERFLSEIKTTANLQHPHILPLFDSGEADGFLYYVMPYVEGETLRDKLDREKQLAVGEAVRIASDVADALDYAHRAGIIHRDIKPANILLHDGRPVVADFGIALAVSAAGGGRMTETGMSLGTPHYMSPEQASADRDLSARSDIYSLGCVLYEMLAGQPPHTGPSAQNILVRILTEDPRSVSELRRTVPPHVASVAMKAIEKLPADRFESARDFREALGDEGFTYTPTSSSTPAAMPAWPPAAAGGRRSTALAATVVVAVVGLGLAAWGWLRPGRELPVIRADLNVSGLQVPNDEFVRVSPDGSTFVVPASDGSGRIQLFVRGTGDADFRTLPGTEGARDPAFSPDGKWIVYRDNAAATLTKVALAGGSPLTLVDSNDISPFQPSWGDDGSILFTGPTGTFRVSETGGTPTRLDIGGNPRSLPGGRGILFTGRDGSGIWVLDLTTDSTWALVPSGLDATYIAPGYLLYGDPQGGLMAVGFDVQDLRVTGDPVPVEDDVGRQLRAAQYSISRDGTLVYRDPGSGRGGFAGGGALRLLEVTLGDGAVRYVPLEPREWYRPRYSPDGRYVVYGSTVEGKPQVFVYDLELGTTPRQLTFEGQNADAVWSPDGTRIAFRSSRDGTQGADLFVKSVNDDTPESSVLSAPGNQVPEDWPAEDQLLYEERADDGRDLWVVDPGQGDEPHPYLQSEAALEWPRVSPDGKWAVYTSDETGKRVVYVRSFPQPRQQTRVSPGNARIAAWGPEGDAIYYFNDEGTDTLFLARVRTDPTFMVLSVEPVVAQDIFTRSDLDISPAGDRAIAVDDVGGTAADSTAEGSRPARFMVVFNWFEVLKERLGQDGR